MINQFPHLSVTRLALGNLRARKKQYILLILGIVLSIAFSATVFFFGEAEEQNSQYRYREEVGNADYVFFDSGAMDTSLLSVLDPSMQMTFCESVGYAYAEADKREYGMTVAVGNEAWREMSGQTLLFGRMPVSENEIAVERAALVSMQITAEVGDTLTLLVDVPDGQGDYIQTEEHTFTLVGILTDKRKNLRKAASRSEDGNIYCDYPAAFLADGTSVSPGGSPVQLTYLQTELDFDAYDAVFVQYYSAHPDHSFKDAQLKRAELASTAEFEWMHIAKLMSICIIPASCFGIVSVFNMNLQDRKRQIGFLRAVGTTKKQILNVFGREALLLAFGCVPAGLFLSWSIVGIMLAATDAPVVYVPTLKTLLLAALLGIAAVLLSALLPLLQATRTSPMQAIRNTGLSVKMKRRKIKSQPFFRVHRLMAVREIKLHGFKNIGVALFLTGGILVSVFAPSLVFNAYDGIYAANYDFHIYTGNSFGATWLNVDDKRNYFSETDLALLQNDTNVGNVNTVRACALAVNTGHLTPYIRSTALYYALFYKNDSSLSVLENRVLQVQAPQEDLVHTPESDAELERLQLPATAFNMPLYIMDEETVARILADCADSQTDMDEINAGQSVIAITPPGVLYHRKDGSLRGHTIGETTTQQNYDEAEISIMKDSLFAGDTVQLYYVQDARNAEEDTPPLQRIVNEVKIGASTQRLAWVMDDFKLYETSCLITTEAGMRALGISAGLFKFTVNMKDNTDPEAQQELHTLLTDIGTRANQYYLDSVYEDNIESRQDRMEIIISYAALIVFIFIVIAATFCNIINAKIRESRHVIGTLRAVGADTRQLMQVYIHQIVVIFGISCAAAYGGTLGFKIYTWISELVTGQENQIQNIVLWVSFLLLAALAAVCALNLAVQLRRETKRSIVENIREL